MNRRNALRALMLGAPAAAIGMALAPSAMAQGSALAVHTAGESAAGFFISSASIGEVHAGRIQITADRIGVSKILTKYETSVSADAAAHNHCV